MAFSKKPQRKGGKPRSSSGTRPSGDRSSNSRPSYGSRPSGDRSSGSRPSYGGSSRPSYGSRPSGDRSSGSRPSYGSREGGRSAYRSGLNRSGGSRERDSGPQRSSWNSRRRDDGDERSQRNAYAGGRSYARGLERGRAVDRSKFMQKAKDSVQEAYRKPDASLVQATRAIDDLDVVKSLLYQRLSEWIQLNFPELDLKNEETVCTLYAEFGDRTLFDDEKVYQLVGAERAKKVIEMASKSFGAEFSEEDRIAIRSLSARVLELFKARTELLAYVEAKAQKEMPNVSALVEPLLAARLLSLAGNLKRLSEMPASTVQVIGAEKALFKHLKNRSINPPKHGILFQSPLINAAPFDQRGKIARALSTKVSIAARADYYTKNDVATKLKADLEKRLAEIRK